MINNLVKENERVDDLQNGYYIIQDPQKFCFGMDAVLLSGASCIQDARRAFYRPGDSDGMCRNGGKKCEIQ